MLFQRMFPEADIYKSLWIESGIPQKRSGIDKRMFQEEILQCRDQRFGIGKAFVLIRGI